MGAGRGKAGKAKRENARPPEMQKTLTGCVNCAIPQIPMKYLSTTPDVMDGALVITGTRIPIDVILYRLKDGYSLAEIHRLYPTPSMQTLQGAISEAIELLTDKIRGKTLS